MLENQTPYLALGLRGTLCADVLFMATKAGPAERFCISIGEEVLEDPRRRLDATRWSADEAEDWNDGTLPIVLTHGYPDSFYRFNKVISLLADPAAHGGDPADAFDVVVPSLPGYAFSDARPDKGGTFGCGDLWHRLMTEVLGYTRFGAHGGDWGSTVTETLARSHAESVVGIHMTDIPFWHSFRRPDDLSHAETRFLEAIDCFQKEDGAYAMIQGTPRSKSPSCSRKTFGRSSGRCAANATRHRAARLATP